MSGQTSRGGCRVKPNTGSCLKQQVCMAHRLGFSPSLPPSLPLSFPLLLFIPFSPMQFSLPLSHSRCHLLLSPPLLFTSLPPPPPSPPSLPPPPLSPPPSPYLSPPPPLSLPP